MRIRNGRDRGRRLTGVIGGLRRQDDGGTLFDHHLGRFYNVVHERVHGRAIRAGRASLLAGAGAVGSAVVVVFGRATVVMAELDDDNITFVQYISDIAEAAFLIE